MKKTKNQFVPNISVLKALIKEGHNNYALILGGGIAHSKKTIMYNEKTKRFIIWNHIDETDQSLTAKQLMDPQITNIGKAMPLNSLICIIK